MDRKYFLIILFGYFFETGQAQNSNSADPIVQAPVGIIQGQRQTYQNSTDQFCIYKGIPFAESPVADLRFRPSIPKAPWTGVFNATSYSPACLNLVGGSSSEDCLYLNILTPNNATNTSKLPILFWIYGGAFMYGDGSYYASKAEEYTRMGTIVVTFNYRVSVFGFLSTGDLECPGNMGLFDQLLALQWVNQNIMAFGGDPGMVTLFGESAGATSVSYLMVSPKSRDQGLFGGAIMQSGNVLTTWSINRNAPDFARGLAALMCPTTINSTKDMMACFRNASASNLNSNANTLWNEIYTGGDAFNQFPIAPVIEINHPDAFMSESNWINLKYGYFQRIPVIIGTTCQEGNFLQSTTLAQYSAKTTVACGLTPWDMNINNNITACQVDLILRQKYFTSNTNYTAQVQKFVGDVLFHKATVKAAKLLCPYTMPVFYYRFCFPNTDAGHGSDTPYTFCTASDFANDTASQTTCQTMMSMWANFAKYRNPIYPNDTNPLLNNVSWSPMDNSNCSNLVYLNISITMNTASNPDDEIIQMWDWLYDFYGQLNYTTY